MVGSDGSGAPGLHDPGDATPYLARPRLTDRLGGTALAVIEAGGGYGKTSLALEFARCIDAVPLRVALTAQTRSLGAQIAESARGAGLPRLADALASAPGDIDGIVQAFATVPEPVVLVLDDVHEYAGQGELMRLAEELPTPHHRVLMVGRYVAGVEAMVARGHATRLELEDLRLTSEEVGTLAQQVLGRSLDVRHVAALGVATGGWVAAVLAALRTVDLHDLGGSLRRSAERVVHDLLVRLSDADRERIAPLAALPMVTMDVAKALGVGDVWEKALAVGVPVRRIHGPWLEIANPVREELTAGAELDRDTVVRAAGAYAEAGEAPTAARLLAGHGCDDELGALIARTSDRDLLRWHTPELLDLVYELPDVVHARHPGALLAGSFLCSTLGDIERRRRFSARLDRSVSREHHERPTVDAELADTLAWTLGDEDRIRSLVGRVLEDEQAPATARARALEVMGRNLWVFERHANQELEDAAADRYFTASIAAWREAGHPMRAVWPLTWRAVMVEWNAGRYSAALRSLDEARALAVGRPLVEVLVLPFRAMVLTEVGRYDEAQRTIAEARTLAAAVGSRSRGAYAAWTAARIASQQGDGDATKILLDEAQALGIRDSGGGAFFAADAAQLLDRVGLAEDAAEQLDHAVAHDDGKRRFVPTAQIVMDCRAGRFEEAIARYEACFGGNGEGTDARERLDLRDLPRVLLMLAYAAHVAGEQDRAAELAIEAFERASRFDVPGVLLLREPDVAHTMLPIAAARGSSAARSLIDDGVAFVRVLGGFSVERLGLPVTVPTGVVAQAVKFLAVNRGRVTADALIDALWPDVDGKLGRQRLRTVLRRVREEVGAGLIQREDESLAFAPGVAIDAEEFDRPADEALRTGDLGAAETAFARYGGELLPDDPYEPWAEHERTRLAWRWLAVLDLLVEAAVEHDDLPRARRLLELGIDAQPEVEDRYLQLAELHARQQRPSRARHVLQRAVDALRSRELEPSARLLHILQRLS